MRKEEPLTDKEYLLEKFAGKGGWTFVRIPEIPPGTNTPFGWVRVYGTIDGVEINNYNLQSMGNGTLFLAVKADIRKKIRKEAGDFVQVTLFSDKLPVEITEELKACFMEEPGIYEIFMGYSFSEQKTIIEWIYAAKTDAIKIARITKCIDTMVFKKQQR